VNCVHRKRTQHIRAPTHPLTHSPTGPRTLKHTDRNAASSRMKGKLEKEERDELIAAGQELKEALGAVEEKVGRG